jgi:hypothetical protein
VQTGRLTSSQTAALGRALGAAREVRLFFPARRGPDGLSRGDVEVLAALYPLGAASSRRRIAERLAMHPAHVARALRILLAARLVVRDPGRRGAAPRYRCTDPGVHALDVICRRAGATAPERPGRPTAPGRPG